MPSFWASSAASTSAPKRLSQMIFICGAATRRSSREGALALDAPIKLGRTVLPAHADVHFIDRTDGSRAARGCGAAVGQYRPLQPRDRSPLPQAISAARAGAARRARRSDCIGSGPYRRCPAARLDRASTSRPQRGSGPPSCRLIGRRPKMSIGRARSPMTRRAIARGRALTPHPSRSTRMALALTGEAATDGSRRGRLQPQFLARSAPRIQPVAPAARPGGSGPRDASIAISTTMACTTPASRSKRAR